jgi:hypothetical protein
MVSESRAKISWLEWFVNREWKRLYRILAVSPIVYLLLNIILISLDIHPLSFTVTVKTRYIDFGIQLLQYRWYESMIYLTYEAKKKKVKQNIIIFTNTIYLTTPSILLFF